MNAYLFSIDCPSCGPGLESLTEGTTDGFRTNAVAKCPKCRKSWLIAVSLTLAGGNVGARQTRQHYREQARA